MQWVSTLTEAYIYTRDAPQLLCSAWYMAAYEVPYARTPLVPQTCRSGPSDAPLPPFPTQIPGIIGDTQRGESAERGHAGHV